LRRTRGVHRSTVPRAVSRARGCPVRPHRAPGGIHRQGRSRVDGCPL